MDKLVFLEDDKCVIWATEDDRDTERGWVVLTDGRVGRGAIGITEDKMREAFALFRKHTGQSQAMNWIQFDAKSPPPKGDYWCEVPALKLHDGGCLCRALRWTGERWEGPGGEYEVARFIPEMLPQLHGRGMDECRDQWKLDASIARIRELESGIGELSKRCEEVEGSQAGSQTPRPEILTARTKRAVNSGGAL